MLTYSILPLALDHFEERVQDIITQYETGVCTCPTFSMTLVPEGNPVWDTVGPLCEAYARYREALSARGIPSGVLVQASLGHGYALTLAPFDTYVNVADGRSVPVYCPSDERFLSHMAKVMRTIAAQHPKMIMLDDDMRLVMRGPIKGCACARHLRALEAKIGRYMTREQLWEHIVTHDDGDPVTLAFLQTQEDALVHTVRTLRAAIDDVDPTIQGVNCTSGDLCESVVHTAPAFCGKGNPTIVRVPNGSYAPISTKGFSSAMRCAAIGRSKLRAHGIDCVIAETDTVPYNRYAKSARYLHAHYTASLLEGLVGAKHWLTRTSSYEPHSGRAYRKILAEHRGLYERLSTLAPGLRPVGACSLFVEQPHYVYRAAEPWQFLSNTWGTKVFERLGLPFYFSAEPGRVSFLEDDIVRYMTDDQLHALFEGSVCVTAEVAEALIARGFGRYLGITVEPWVAEAIHGEIYGEPYLTSSKQKGARKLTVTDERTEVLSHCFHRAAAGQRERLFPAVTLLEREGGRFTVVFCGTPDAEHTYGEGFAFLTETRKGQLVDILRRAKALPIWCESDVELCLRTAYTADGRLLAALYHLGTDPLDALDVHMQIPPVSVSLLTKDGDEQPVDITHLGDDLYRLQVPVEPLYPVLLLIR